MRWTQPCSAYFLRATTARRRTAKSCGPGAATVASIRAGPCWRGNGDKKTPLTGESTKETVKPLRGESRDDWLNLWWIYWWAFFVAPQATGAVGARLSLRPFFGEGQR